MVTTISSLIFSISISCVKHNVPCVVYKCIVRLERSSRRNPLCLPFVGN